MVESDEKLARRAVACKHWRWMAGMAYSTFDAGWRYHGRVVQPESFRAVDPLPLLHDPATIGCLVGLVRVAYNDGTMAVYSMHGCEEWVASSYTGDIGWFFGETEAEALVMALEAAP